MIKVNIVTGQVFDEGVPDFLRSLDQQTLRNLQTSLDDGQIEQLGLQDIEFWPESTQQIEPLEFGYARGEETLTADTESKTVNISCDARPMTGEEIEQEKLALKEQVIRLMSAKQDGGIIFNGIKIDTGAGSMARMAGAKVKSRAFRKIVPRFMRGLILNLSESQFSELFDTVEEYQQKVQDHAYDLIELIEQWESAVDLDSGWPSNEFSKPL